MVAIGKVIGDSLKKLFFRELRVARVRELSAHFKRVDFESEALRGARFATGDKLQVALDDGPRTYTPFAFDGARGTLSLLVYLHGEGSSARWGKTLCEGARVHAFGPRGSLSLASESGPIVLFGDETSFALARALLEARGTASGLRFIFEASRAHETSTVLDSLELPSADSVERRADESHLSAVEERVRAALALEPATRLVLTGKAQSIQTLRKQLKARPVAHGGQLVKAYWSPGKRGLD
jgi:NADPH-dependent ferric siderophore reductase